MSAPVRRAYDAAAVVIPARNERAKLPACLRAVLTAALCAPILVTVAVVLDDGDDGSAQFAGEYGPDVHFISIDAHNVGAARAVGFGYVCSLLPEGAECWYATTDAGSRVDPGWLAHQFGLGADMVLGAVGHRLAPPRRRARRTLSAVLSSGPPVRGRLARACSRRQHGIQRQGHRRLGGFRMLSSGEDVDLVERSEAAG